MIFSIQNKIKHKIKSSVIKIIIASVIYQYYFIFTWTKGNSNLNYFQKWLYLKTKRFWFCLIIGGRAVNVALQFFNSEFNIVQLGILLITNSKLQSLKKKTYDIFLISLIIFSRVEMEGKLCIEKISCRIFSTQ